MTQKNHCFLCLDVQTEFSKWNFMNITFLSTLVTIDGVKRWMGPEDDHFIVYVTTSDFIFASERGSKCFFLCFHLIQAQNSYIPSLTCCHFQDHIGCLELRLMNWKIKAAIYNRNTITLKQNSFPWVSKCCLCGVPLCHLCPILSEAFPERLE